MHRPQQEGRAPHPVGQRRAIQVDALAGVNLGLAVKREASRAGGSHPDALPEPYVTLSRLRLPVFGLDHTEAANEQRDPAMIGSPVPASPERPLAAAAGA